MARLDLLHDPAYLDFWRARHLCTVTTQRSDGSLHVTPMGIVLDPEREEAWGITSASSVKARNLAASGGAPVAVCQVAGAHWASLEGIARITSDPDSVREAEERYAARYKVPRPNPNRVALRIGLTRALGRAPQ
ncbi:TIGR03618 family F420-dependent PPOX class oxidoreductase [Nocardioides sp. JQ2195]|uniref:TIGR03618 family F420-dependent PPOX class oxidoreductase n=1 Tax=Nocardioides sp. JQ2195 TaxID=2592334 RepID=UPI00143EE2B1|nr:TIGR03618 family F420-dependent PPOX class oxidoreductase [Nocardioides sp. JQ2195]QIX26735.1 TIGR03618 family F420-dependent PPOX class oxidoreductase [Nocardioides sp. JQ2195]